MSKLNNWFRSNRVSNHVKDDIKDYYDTQEPNINFLDRYAIKDCFEETISSFIDRFEYHLTKSIFKNGDCIDFGFYYGYGVGCGYGDTRGVGF